MKFLSHSAKLFFIAALAFFLPTVFMTMPNTTDPVQAAQAKAAPAFSLDNVNGGKVSLASYRGKVVVLNFWATWCGPCIAELPDFKAISSEFGPKGVQVIGLSIDGGPDVVKTFLQKNPLNYVVAMSTGKVSSSYGVTGSIPQTFIIDRKGKLRKSYTTRINKQQVVADINALLAEK
ncbi:MAG TPA: TlpA disulfide reductase family protein [Acidobacteriota bacterium]|nr:TlpA disulfide reductase family protein [Acidobacteriota bacterium]HNB72012.1 TlpA disulfide reductase family protein [Acidobacteriota bacterium]HND19901.1 TlpA disulfide reductase family protein [Acidobacteriota bacterium]HNG96484.1 TlpA disulfide reductase family protein [Acidobacteriota bacterium]HNH81202.1 TlpA disulfide reductase family protein [Acidobacteriota bacterium]